MTSIDRNGISPHNALWVSGDSLTTLGDPSPSGTGELPPPDVSSTRRNVYARLG